MAKNAIKTVKVSEEQLAVMAGNVTRTIGEAEAGLAIMQTSTEKAVEEQLVALKNAGFTVDMLKSKHPCRKAMEDQMLIAYVRGRSQEYRDYYQEMISKKETPEVPEQHWFKARKLPVISVPDSTRYNRFSAIRQWFELNSGKKSFPLDLYGNKARAEQAKKAAKKSADKSTRGNTPAAGENGADEAGTGKAVTNQVKPNLKGTGPLLQFCNAWLEENRGVAACNKYITAVEQLARIIEADMPKK